MARQIFTNGRLYNYQMYIESFVNQDSKVTLLPAVAGNFEKNLDFEIHKHSFHLMILTIFYDLKMKKSPLICLLFDIGS